MSALKGGLQSHLFRPHAILDRIQRVEGPSLKRMSIPSRRCFPAAQTPLPLLPRAGFLLGGCIVLGAVLAAFCPPPASAAQAETAEDGFLSMIVRSPLERAGDLDALAVRWLEE